MKMERQRMKDVRKHTIIRLGKSHGTLKMSGSVPPLPKEDVRPVKIN